MIIQYPIWRFSADFISIFENSNLLETVRRPLAHLHVKCYHCPVTRVDDLGGQNHCVKV